MKVPDISLFFITLISIISLLTPLIFYILVRREYVLSLKVMLIAGIIWLLFAQIFEKGLHLPLIAYTDIEQYPFIFALLSGIITSVLQVIGRYVAFTQILKKYQRFEDGVAYGIGHAGVEAIFIGCMTSMQFLYYSRMLNMGSFISLEDQLPYMTYNNLMGTLTGPYLIFLLLGVERIFLFLIQVAITLVILLGVRMKKWWMVGLAIGLNILVAVPDLLFQEHVLSILLVEMYFAILAGCSVWFIIYSSKKPTHS